MWTAVASVVLILGVVSAADVETNSIDGFQDSKDWSSSSTVMAKCTYVNCNAFCRSIGYITGHCIGDSCICTMPREENGNYTIVQASLILNSCDQIKCNQICQLLGFKRGICSGDTCECTQIEETEDTLELCNINLCEQLCLPGRFLLWGQVQMRYNSGNPGIDSTVDTSTQSLSDCQPLVCEQLCRRIKRQGGVCVNGHCKCDIFSQLQSLLKFSGQQSSKTRSMDCIDSQCSSACRRMHYDDGSCIGGNCECHALFPIEGSSVPVPLDDNSCHRRQCRNFCLSAGFNGSNCEGIKCRCGIKLHRKRKIRLPRMSYEIKKIETNTLV
ncbi:tenascin-like [Plodia interpunctella]|uniref:tenascin-like n=1 Tax=Plodia interpunctella TaxID=58824 RepID=UPI0023688B22|nr:tenascin-like [Plodia interpunctella]